MVSQYLNESGVEIAAVGYSDKNAGSTLNHQVRGRSALAVELFLDGEAEALTRKAMEMALGGDGPAKKLCLDRLLSPRRDQSITFALPIIESAADLPKATEAMLHAVASGRITPSDAADFGKAVSATSRRSPLLRWPRASLGLRRPVHDCQSRRPGASPAKAGGASHRGGCG